MRERRPNRMPRFDYSSRGASHHHERQTPRRMAWPPARRPHGAERRRPHHAPVLDGDPGAFLRRENGRVRGDAEHARPLPNRTADTANRTKERTSSTISEVQYLKLKFKLNEKDIVINKVNRKGYLGKSELIPGMNETIIFESNMTWLAINVDKIHLVPLIHLLATKFIKVHILQATEDSINQSSINPEDVRKTEYIDITIKALN